MTNSQQLAEEFEKLYSAYISKLRRLDELKAQGRYGYQLRMPRYALRQAIENLQAFGKTHGIEVDSLF